jgi:cell division protein FtsX
MRNQSEFTEDDLVNAVSLFLMAVVLALLLSGCKVKKNIEKESIKVEEKTEQRVEIQEETTTTSRARSLSQIREVLNGNSIIYPRGKFIFLDGKFEGEADSVITSNQEIRSIDTDVKELTTKREEIQSVEEISTEQDTEFKTSTRQIERSPNFLGWIGGLLLFLFLIFIIHKMRTWKP